VERWEVGHDPLIPDRTPFGSTLWRLGNIAYMLKISVHCRPRVTKFQVPSQPSRLSRPCVVTTGVEVQTLKLSLS